MGSLFGESSWMPAPTVGEAQVPGGNLLHGAFLTRAAAQPDAPAVICRDRALSYGELSRRASTLAARLRGAGASRGQLVGVSVEKGWQQVVAALGVLQAGAGYLPIDPEWPLDLRHRVLGAEAPRFLVTDASRPSGDVWGGCARTITLDDDRDMTPAPAEMPSTTTTATGGPRPYDLACVVRARSSPAGPRIHLDHRISLETIRRINAGFQIDHADCFLAIAPFDDRLVLCDFFGALAAGATVIVPAADEGREPRQWLELVEDYGVTVLTARLIDEGSRSHPSALTSIKLVVLNGDPMPPELPGRIRWYAPRAQIIRLVEDPWEIFRLEHSGLN
jgi:non-ribosomal peptide synthetase component F